MTNKYPKQIGRVMRKTKTLGVDAHLLLPIKTENKSPLEIHSNISRVVFTIIDNTGKETIFPSGNIPATEVGYVYKLTKTAMDIKRQREFLPWIKSVSDEKPKQISKADNNSLAYEVKLADRTFRNKTPAEVLIADPNNKDKLLSIRDWLVKNQNKYPANKRQINAIDSAIELLNAGQLANDDDVAVLPTKNLIPIYDSGIKFRRKVDKKTEKNQIYQIKINYDIDKDYPIYIEIMNGFAPVTDTQSGGKNIRMTEAEKITKSFMLLTESEWFELILQAVKTVSNFETINFKKQFELSEEASFKDYKN